MTKIPLTIARDYMPKWGVTEGLRELVQNWLDANDNGGGTIETGDDDTTVSLVNTGATLSRDALLLGTTSKRNTDKRGQFGEGLKLGTLALVRAGCDVTIEAGGERWTASIEPSEDFGGREVLTWTIEPSEVPHVVVRVGGLGWGDWTTARSLFLAFTDVGACERTPKGTILLDSAQTGRVYVRGIFVAHVEDLAYGYDLTNTRVDRDRQLMATFDLQWETSQILASVAKSGKVAAADVLRTAMEEGWEAKYLSSHADTETREKVAAAFVELHGPRAVPCKTSEDQETVARYGYRGVVTPEELIDLVGMTVGTVDSVVQNARRTVHTTYTTDDLTEAEAQTVAWITEQVRAAATGWTDACPLRIGDFADPEARALHTPHDYRTNAEITIARWALADRYAALAVLVAMVGSHLTPKGSDVGGTREAIWTNLARRWNGAVTETIRLPDAAAAK